MKKLSLLLSSVLLLVLLPLSASAADTNEGFPAGTTLTFEASSDGVPPATFEWFRDGVKIADGATFTIAALAPANAGRYTVKATNPAGSATSVDGYVLQVFVAPSPPTFKVTAKKPTDVTLSVPKGVKVVYQ